MIIGIRPKPLLRTLACACGMALALSHGLHAQDVDPEYSEEARVLPDDQRSYSPLTRQAEAYYNEGKYKPARKLFEQVEKRSLSSRERAHAILAQGDCYLKQGKNWKAYEKYRKAVDSYASFIPYNKVLNVEFSIAEKSFSGTSRRWLLLPVSDREKAIEIYEHISKTAPYSELAPKAIFRAAQLAEAENDYPRAIDKYNELVTRYPGSDDAANARVELARCLLTYADMADGDGALTRAADSELKRFIANNPEHPRLDEAKALQGKSQELEAERYLYLGEFYQRGAHRRLTASARYLNTVTENYPNTESAAAAQPYIARLTELQQETGEAIDPTGARPTAAIPTVVTLPDGTQGVRNSTTGQIQPILEGTQNSDKWLLPIIDLHPTTTAPVNMPADTVDATSTDTEESAQ